MISQTGCGYMDTIDMQKPLSQMRHKSWILVTNYSNRGAKITYRDVHNGITNFRGCCSLHWYCNYEVGRLHIKLQVCNEICALEVGIYFISIEMCVRVGAFMPMILLFMGLSNSLMIFKSLTYMATNNILSYMIG